MAFKIRAKEVILLSVRERILTIRLLDKVTSYPMYTAALGIEYVQKMAGSDDLEEPP